MQPRSHSWTTQHTVLGWTIIGTSSHQLPTTAETLLVQTPTLDDELFHQVQNWIRLDNEGVSLTKKAFSANDRRAENILQSTTTKVGDRYQISLLWKPNVDLPKNRWVAERQLRTLEQRLQKDPTLKEQYKKTIDDDLAKGYIVEVPTVDATLKNWYLPHHPVTNVNKPGKVRRKTNASSVFKGQSLNNNLLTGPDFLCNLTGLIMRFRQHSVALSADIEAMLMQVLVDPKDRQYIRFLWSNDTKTINFEYTRHIFGEQTPLALPAMPSASAPRAMKLFILVCPQLFSGTLIWMICISASHQKKTPQIQLGNFGKF